MARVIPGDVGPTTREIAREDLIDFDLGDGPPIRARAMLVARYEESRAEFYTDGAMPDAYVEAGPIIATFRLEISGVIPREAVWDRIKDGAYRVRVVLDERSEAKG